MDRRMEIKRKLIMKRIILLAILTLFVVSCKEEVKSLRDLNTNFYQFQQQAIHLGDSLSITFKENEDKIDSMFITVNGNRIENNSIIDESIATLGANLLEMYVYVDGNNIYGKTSLAVLNPEKEQPVEFEIINKYTHPNELFTQGLFYHNGLIYESSGQYGRSKMVNYRLGQSNYLNETKLDANHFAEGAEIIDGKVYQLTLKARKIFVYDPNTLELINTLDMPEMVKEGWGLTTNGEEIIISDGSQNIYFFDKDLNFNRKIQVTGNLSIYTNINEMEYINDRIYANVWLTNFILIINPETGAVEQYYDLNEINESKSTDDVLNGIAFYEGNILVTGKNWNFFYELNLPKS